MEIKIAEIKRQANKLYFEAIKLEYKEEDDERNYGTKKNGFFYTKKELFNEIVFLNIPISLLNIINTYAYDYIYNLADIYNTYPRTDNHARTCINYERTDIYISACTCTNYARTYIYKRYAIELVDEICYIVDIYTKKLFDQHHVLYLKKLRHQKFNIYENEFYSGESIIGRFYEEDNKIVLRGYEFSLYANINFLEITFCEDHCIFREQVARQEIDKIKNQLDVYVEPKKSDKTKKKGDHTINIIKKSIKNINNKKINVLEFHMEFDICFIIFLYCDDNDEKLYILHYDGISRKIITYYPLNIKLAYWHADIYFNRIIDNNLEISICSITGEHIYIFQKHII
jgi:hypothetical protein